MNNRYRKLGEILQSRGLITDQQIESALEIQKRTGDQFGRIMIKQGWITESFLLDALSEKFDLPVVKIGAYSIDPAIVKSIPMELAQRYNIIPLFLVDDMLTLAMSDPLDLKAMDAVRYHTKLNIQEVLAAEKDIETAIKKYYSMAAYLDRMVTSFKEDSVVELNEDTDNETNLDATDEASIINFVNVIISQAIREKASDIHMEMEEKEFRIRYRIDGVLHPFSTPPKKIAPMVVSRIKVLAELDVSEKRVPQDGRFRVKIVRDELDLRVSILPTVHGEKVVLRILDPRNAELKLADLGFQPRTLQLWDKAIRKPEGIILITGPTGSGKTTTLYSVLNTINSIHKNIVTIENPVEYKFPLINQVQVNFKVGLTFAGALRSILRQDPDVIMVGEIRDSETADIAIRSAMTGHLVLSTLHTNDAVSGIFRLMDMEVEPFLLASSVIGILAQRLVRRVCPHCKVEDTEGLRHLKENNYKLRDNSIKLYRGAGCRECKKTGYIGRTGIHELLLFDSNIRRKVLDKAPEEDIRKYAVKSGMALLRHDGLRKAFDGTTTIEEVLRVT
ncbi:MAG: type II secretion system protein GspE [Calditrichaeota bacterium]|nr:MAG: type II secretion system protein GspE [Calditrichota bacterium]